MATVEPKALYGVSPAEPQQKYFTVAIAQGAFSDASSTAGGRVSLVFIIYELFSNIHCLAVSICCSLI